MKRVKCSKLQPGMVLAEDVFGRNGEIIIPIGAQLTEKSIKLLELWAIPSIAVEGKEENLLDLFTPEQIAEVNEEIQGHFTPDAGNISLVGFIMKLTVQRRLKQKFPEALEEENEDPTDD
ncbi:MAG: hypothetical protein ACOY3I_01950 [Verrucomicrobiota bacterium]